MSTSIEKDTLSCASKSFIPSGPKVKDSNGVPRYGGLKASFKVRLERRSSNAISGLKVLKMNAY